MRTTIKALCIHAVNVTSHTKGKMLSVITQKLSIMVLDTTVKFARRTIPRLRASEIILKLSMKEKNIFVKNVKNP